MKSSENALAQIKLLASELDSGGLRSAIDGLMLTGLARVVRKQMKGNHGGHVTRKTLADLADAYVENCAASFRSAAGEAINKLVTPP